MIDQNHEKNHSDIDGIGADVRSDCDDICGRRDVWFCNFFYHDYHYNDGYHRFRSNNNPDKDSSGNNDHKNDGSDDNNQRYANLVLDHDYRDFIRSGTNNNNDNNKIFTPYDNNCYKHFN